MKTPNEPVANHEESAPGGLFHAVMETLFVLAIVGGLFAFIAAYAHAMWQVLRPFLQHSPF